MSNRLDPNASLVEILRAFMKRGCPYVAGATYRDPDRCAFCEVPAPGGWTVRLAEPETHHMDCPWKIACAATTQRDE